MPRLAGSAAVSRGVGGRIIIDGEEFPWYTASDDDATVNVEAHRTHAIVWIPVIVAGPVTLVTNTQIRLFDEETGFADDLDMEVVEADVINDSDEDVPPV